MIDCTRHDVVTALYQRVGRCILDKCRKMLRCRSTAEEALQEVFLRLYQDGARFESERQAFRWLYRASHNHCVDIIRTRGFKSVHAVEAEFWETVEAAGDVGRSLKDFDACRKLLAGLPERLAQVLWYIAVDGLTQDEVAELLDISRATVARDLRDAKTLMKDQNFG